MGQIATSRQIAAPAEKVFDVVAHVDNFRNAVPDIVRIEYVTETHKGVGTRFKETRRMGKREATVELEVTEYEPHQRVRIVSDAGGTVWDTTFRVTANGDGAELTMVMDDKPYKLLAKLFTPLIRPMVRKAVAKDMDAVKAYCEGSS
ncbi:MAG: SRPBCC family protein [Planctomycetes bacterium]|nr:SRPBCC family protein [Planctomycetota bacterium]